VTAPSVNGVSSFSSYRAAWQDGERVFLRERRDFAGRHQAVLVVLPATEHPTLNDLNRLVHEFDLKDYLDDAWAVRPLELVREHGTTMLVLADPGGEPLQRLIKSPIELQLFLRLAISLSAAVGRLHDRGLIHKDIKPANVIVNPGTGRAWLTGFGIASRLPRERQPPEPPEYIAGTLAYMAPEQTGRMNRSIDSRSDLYSLGVTFYEMLTGCLPFTASDPMELMHCHIARNAVPPVERLKDIPAVVSEITMKLLAKTAEQRYQTGAAVERDLRRCLVEWKERRRIDEFPLGEHDTPRRLIIPEKLYGRESEINTLLASFDRVVAGNKTELVLISGYSGVGKSSVVNELHKLLVSRRGLFASGKFDQHKHDIPYATLAQAFQSLVRPLLGKSQAELQDWRNAMQEALGPNGLLIIDIVPELALIIGEQPQVPELPPQDTQRRFQLVLRKFIAVFARPECPLVLFLDDLQWGDVATLDLIEDLLTSDTRSLLLIGAYRDNEVNSTHPLMRKLQGLRAAGAGVLEIIIQPLTLEDLRQLIADSLYCEPQRITSLAKLVHDKTAGNPFFAIQFVSSLAEDGLLTLDPRYHRWSWDLIRIRTKGYSDNVADLMVAKLNRLSNKTQKALQHVACLGNSVEFPLAAIVFQNSREDMHKDLLEAVKQALIFRTKTSYSFLHDRVQEAAYSLIPERSRAATHLRIGNLLVSHTPPEKLEERIFEIVNQLTRGVGLITSRKERERLAELNLIAAKRAKVSAAYDSALKYLVAGAALLMKDPLEHPHDLYFQLELNRAECEFLTGQLAAADERLDGLSSRATNNVELASVACLRMDLYITLDRSDRAVDVFLDYLKNLGVEWSAHPSDEQGLREYEGIWSRLGSREIEELVNVPLTSDSTCLATLDVLTKALPPVMFRNANLGALAICRAVNLSLEHGFSDGTSFAFVYLGMIAGPHFGNYDAGFRFGQLGYELVERRGLKRFQARTYMCFGSHVMLWTRHVRACRAVIHRAFEAANRIGDLTFAAYSCNNVNTNLLAAGDPLAEAQRKVEFALHFAEKSKFGLVIDIVTAQHKLIQTLTGQTPIFGSFNNALFDEVQFERHLSDDPAALPECFYWIRKMQARFFAGDYDSAVDASLKAQPLLWTAPSNFEMTEYHFYGALSRAAAFDFATLERRQIHFEALTAHYMPLQVWAENCPENFENRAALVGAEIARLEGRMLDAERLYEQAIGSARASGFVHNEGLSHEVAARFYEARGFRRIAEAYLQDARDCYARWGAIGKVRQLEQLYPHLKDKMPPPDLTSTIVAPVEHLDLATVIKVSEAISSEIIPQRLIDTILRTAIEHMGAQRGLLILAQDDKLRIGAEATTDGTSITVHLRDTSLAGAALPMSIVHYVVRTQENVILDDASTQNQFAADTYIFQYHARSVLCVPLLNQGKLIGLLYLENNLAPYVFTSGRMAVLKLLASEAAMSLANTRLYNDLQKREARVRRLVDSNIIGIFIWCFDGRLVDANDAFLRIVGYSREDFVTGGLHWKDLTPVEWRDEDNRRASELRMTGVSHPYEKEYFRKDGGRVPVLVGAALFEENGDEGVAFVVDLTDQKKADEAARESEERYRQVQMELVHANRILIMGQLSASIGHEINHPIAAAIGNAGAALRWLRHQPPNLEEVRMALERIMENGIRAGKVIDHIRALAKKAPLGRDSFEINKVILEIMVLTRSEMAKNAISVRTQFGEDLLPIRGDRVQVQQVILNIVINAIDAMSKTSEGPRDLLISTRKTETDDVLVSVQDSGPGFSPESAERLFDAFYTTKPNGLGIGLSICLSIIEAHQGQLWATPNVPRGAVFQFTLPPYSI
jgi:PAS domain S-box-containing protein